MITKSLFKNPPPQIIIHNHYTDDYVIYEQPLN